MHRLLREGKALLLKTIFGFSDDNCFTLAAALSYYALFSLAPLLVIIVSALSLVAGSQEVLSLINEQTAEYMGEQAASTITGMVRRAYQPSSSIVASLVGLGTLALTATVMLANLQNSMNIVWGVAQYKPFNIRRMVRDRLVALLLILAMGLLLLLLTIAQAVMTGAFDLLTRWLPVGTLVTLENLQQAVSFLGLALLIGVIYKVLPDAKLSWRDVVVGALVTALLLFLGKTAIAYYLGQSATATLYGPASAVILVLLWLYYSSLILFLGAEFTQAWASMYGKTIRSPWQREKQVEEAFEEQRKRKEDKERVRLEEEAGEEPVGDARAGQVPRDKPGS